MAKNFAKSAKTVLGSASTLSSADPFNSRNSDLPEPLIPARVSLKGSFNEPAVRIEPSPDRPI